MRPYPVPDLLSEPFWSAANRSVLAIQRCRSCRRYQHYPQMLCSACGGTDLGFEPVSGRGRIFSWSIVHEARHEAFRAIQPYPVAEVELVEQAELVLLANVEPPPGGRLAIGAEVEVFFEQVSESQAIPQFRLAA